MAGQDQAGEAENDLRRRGEEQAGGVTVSAPTNGVETMVAQETGGVTIAAASDAEANAHVPSDPVATNPATSRSFGLGSALGVPVKPGGRGSPPPYGGIDLSLYPRQMEIEGDAERMRAEHEYNNKLREAIRDDELGIYFGPDKTKNTYNDLLFSRLGPGGIFANEIKRARHTKRAREAIGDIKAAFGVDAELERVREKERRGEGLGPGERSMLENAHLVPQITSREKEKGFRKLVAAMAGLEHDPKSPGLRKLGQAKNAGEYLDVLVNHPLEIFSAKAGQEFHKISASYGGKLIGGPIVGVLAASYVTFGSEFADAIVEGFEKEGIDLQDKSAVFEAIANKDLMRKIYGNASKRAGIAVATEIVSGFVGSRQLTPGKSAIVEGVTQAGAQAGIGAAGKFAADKAIGEKPVVGGIIDNAVDGALESLLP